MYLYYLNKITTVNRREWTPVAMYFLYPHNTKHRNSKEVSLFFKKLERLSAYLHLTSKYEGKRITRYSRVLTAIKEENEKGFDNIIDSMKLTEEEIQEMRKLLMGNVYNEFTPVKRKYLLRRLNSFLTIKMKKFMIQKLLL